MSNSLDHFEIPKNVEDRNASFKAKCVHCSSVISGSLRITSNFVTHLKRKHRDVYLESLKPKPEEQQKISTFVQHFGKKYNPNDPKQKEALDALILFIAGDLLPFSTVESQHFKNFIEKLDSKFQIPSRKHFSSKLIYTKAKEIRQKLYDQLQQSENICLTVDLWSNRSMKGFLGITAHFILDWEMKSAMISCKRFKGRHTADNILHEYEETITSFDINNKIFCVISDNASNMVKAFRFSVPGYDDEDEVEDSVDEDFQEDVDQKVTDIDHPFPQHKRCYAHSLQLVIRDAFDECGQTLKKVIAKVSKIVSHVRKSLHASEILEGEKRLQACNATRWNSQMHMIRSILSIPEEKMEKLDCTNISAYDRKVLNEICKILKPFEEATLLVQREKSVSGSMVLSVTLGLRQHLDAVKCDYSTKFVSVLKSSLQNRLAQYEEDEVYKTSSMLDPRFKVLWSKPENVEGHVLSLQKKVSVLDSVQTEEDDVLSPPAKREKTDNFFSFLPKGTPKRKRHASGSVQTVQRYIEEDCLDSDSDPLQFWKIKKEEYPTLAKLAQKYLTIPASSASVERLFSIAGKVFRPDRMKLKDETFETLMMLKCNSHFA